MRKEISIDDWNRREHFRFFAGFEEPFFGLVAPVEVTVAYQKAKEQGWSFYLYYLYLSLMAANRTEPFCYRMEEDKIYRYDAIHASTTVLRDDKTFGFSFIEYRPAFAEFVALATAEIAAVKAATGLRITPNTVRPDTIHYSSIPWVSFTGLTHARSFTYKDSVPKISFGKLYRASDQMLLPVAINVHHGLLDGYHVGKYLQTFQALLNGEEA